MAEPEPATATVGALRAEISGWERKMIITMSGAVLCAECVHACISREHGMFISLKPDIPLG